MKESKKGTLATLILLLLSIVLILFSLSLGFYKISINDLISFFIRGENSVSQEVGIIIMNIRLPRILAAFLIGAALSIAGTCYQGMFKNPLVSPDILGVSSGAGLGAALALTMRLSSFGVQIYAFIFGILVVTITYFIGSRTRYSQDVTLILSGTMLGALSSSLISLLKYLADPNDTLPSITFWLMGSLNKVTNTSLLFSTIPIIIGIIILFLYRYRINILTLSDDEASSLGINPKQTRLIVITATTIISAAAVCLGGIIGWVGLMIPHLSRGIVGADYRRLLPFSLLLGGFFLLIMDNLARTMFVMEIPLGLLTSIIGAPFFIILILRYKR